MHDIPLLINITMALVAAFIGGYLARLISLPPMVGYLLAGVAIGPFTPGYVGDISTIQQLAELGVIFLMFGVGLHFSLRDLWAVRAIAIPGTFLSIGIMCGLMLLCGYFFGWTASSGLLLGLSVAIASTVVLLRNLMDQGLLNTSAGRIAVGWLVLEDLVTVLILVLLPALATPSPDPFWVTAGIALLKAGAFAALMLLLGTRAMPILLTRIAHVRSRELFIVAIVATTVGIAIGASYLFGVSLALGAFLAGVVVSESSLSHHVGAEILPFRDIFTVLFFVSVGMLVNPFHLWAQAPTVLLLSLIIVVGKWLVTLLLGLLLAWTARTTLVLAAGRSQIGEFSFILAETGVALGLLAQEQYSLVLSGALLSITLNPLLFRLLPWTERNLKKIPAIWSLLNRKEPPISAAPTTFTDHVVVVGYGRVGGHMVQVLTALDIPRLVIDLDVHRITLLEQLQIPSLYGDAANSEILHHARIEEAREVVITVPDETAALVVVAAVHQMAPHVPVVVRAATQAGVGLLMEAGATAVIHPELEGGLEIVRQTLGRLGYVDDHIQSYIDAVRGDKYDTSIVNSAEEQALSLLRTKEKEETNNEQASVSSN